MSSLSPIDLSADQRVTYKKLLDLAVRSRNNAYAPFSQSKVGAAALGPSGKVYLGINCELTGQADHAEQVAINQALVRGEKSLEAIAVFVAPEGEVREEHYQKNSFPCGNCRQALFELNPEILVIQADGLEQVKAYKLADMLPNAYQRKRQKLEQALALESPEPLIDQALKARSHSLAIRTGYPEGAAVQTESGVIYPGVKAELSSFTSRAVRMAVAGAYLNGDHKIKRVALVAGHHQPECPDTISWDCLQSIYQANPKAQILYPDRSGRFVEQTILDFLSFVVTDLNSQLSTAGANGTTSTNPGQSPVDLSPKLFPVAAK